MLQISLSEYNRSGGKTNEKITAYYDKIILPWRHKRGDDSLAGKGMKEICTH